jgi:hypothetical protein
MVKLQNRTIVHDDIGTSLSHISPLQYIRNGRVRINCSLHCSRSYLLPLLKFRLGGRGRLPVPEWPNFLQREQLLTSPSAQLRQSRKSCSSLPKTVPRRWTTLCPSMEPGTLPLTNAAPPKSPTSRPEQQEAEHEGNGLLTVEIDPRLLRARFFSGHTWLSYSVASLGRCT